jgi:hypothetical protein
MLTLLDELWPTQSISKAVLGVLGRSSTGRRISRTTSAPASFDVTPYRSFGMGIACNRLTFVLEAGGKCPP